MYGIILHLQNCDIFVVNLSLNLPAPWFAGISIPSVFTPHGQFSKANYIKSPEAIWGKFGDDFPNP